MTSLSQTLPEADPLLRITDLTVDYRLAGSAENGHSARCKA